RGQKKGGGNPSPPTGEKAKQSVPAMSDSRVGQQPSHIGLSESNEVPQQYRQRGQCRQQRRPPRQHHVPGSVAVGRSETDQHDFSEDNERGNLGTGRKESGPWNRRALISIGRPK